MDDLVLRAITESGAFRVIAARTTASAKGVVQAQKAKGETARVLAELLTGTIIVREAMSPDLRVQGILQIGRGRMVADAYPGGGSRGLVQEGGGGPLDPSRGGVLQLMRSLHNGALHQGIVDVSEMNVSNAIALYMRSSEQVASFVSVAALVREDEVIAAGGFLVQLLPEVDRGALMIMTERLEDFTPLPELMTRGDAAPDRLMEELLHAMPYELVGRSTLRYECPCDEARVAASLSTLPKSEIREMIEAGEMLEIECDYCHRQYRFAPGKLRGLLAAS